ncbi:hypothetical protein EGR_11293 [Echinococcus granulosus]|uniref:Uncharacterized protein n=1 Tax=Echinococcus granulosus TaxID=6210 RepID=W6U061_ECHGR|nr:hypothetical protein EGR_11293 [Echinococcus granulosus]EUB53856.1 hypothetical protein EGR_11293 [Echinococcus granulosus]
MEEEEDSGLKESNRCAEDAARCQIDYIEVVQQGDAQLLRSHTTQLVHKAPHLPITRVQRAPVIARCQSREFQVVFEPTIDEPGTSQL